MTNLSVNNYQVKVMNRLDSLDPFFDELKIANRLFLITDQTVFSLYYAKLESLTKRELIWYVLSPGEKNKSVKVALAIISYFIDQKIKRSDTIVSFGGGVVSDLAGFVASNLFRGVNLIHIPTTITGQVDSAIGGKNAVNFKNYKNQIGTFYDPILVINSLEWFSTLPKKEINNGFVEIIKDALIGSNSLYLELLKLNKIKITQKLVIEAIKIKKTYVKKDYQDKGERQFLNFGHTFGHAIEAASNFKVSHGEAVACGILKALAVGEKLKLTRPGLYEEVSDYFKRLNLVRRKYSFLDYRDFLYHDKKASEEGLRLVLLKDVSKPFLLNVKWSDLDEIKD